MDFFDFEMSDEDWDTALQVVAAAAYIALTGDLTALT